MAIVWKKTKFLGVRYREHNTRKHVGNRPDKCFYIHYKVDGKTRDESVGWSSENVTAESAFQILSQLRENIRIGRGPRTLAELRAENEQEVMREQQEKAQEQSRLLTFSQFWDSDYFPAAQAGKRQGTVESERWLYSTWIAPAIGNIPLRNLTVRDIELLVNKAKKAGKSPATIRYILAVISQIWNKAEMIGVISGTCPCKKVKKPREDNRRMRFLSQEEASELLADLSLHSKDMHDIALLSLYTGLRAGEIHALIWGNIDTVNNVINVVDTKNKKNRHAFMTSEVKNMLLSRYRNQPKTSLVFPGRNGCKRRWVSDTFDRSVNRLGLNDSGEYRKGEDGESIPVPIADARQRVVFHTLRHTFASWLVQKGVPLYTVAELMGHSTIDMTRRYSHLAPNSLKSAALTLEGVLATD